MGEQVKIRCYAAPMEGITGYIYRNAHHRSFYGIDKYFTPFLTPKPKKDLNTREKNDILPGHNRDIPVVPQILTNRADDFIRLAGFLEQQGYEEVNLNLGCPSGTVVAKGKGSGFLAEPEKLGKFFEDIFSSVHVKVSVKTRLGMEDPREIVDLIKLYNEFPISEVIIHARVRNDYYRKPVNREAFRNAVSLSRHPVCYNGDLFTPQDIENFRKEFPEIGCVMLGRGMIANPGLCECISGRENDDRLRWKDFLEEICVGYEEIMSGEKNVLFKMKEIWSYMMYYFPGKEKYGKKIKKAKNLCEYQNAVNALFKEMNV